MNQNEKMKFIIEIDEIKGRSLNNQNIFIEFHIENDLFFRSESIADINTHVHSINNRSGRSIGHSFMKPRWMDYILDLQ